MESRTNPPLPLPTLRDTCARYLKSLRPLLQPRDLAKTELVVSEFERSDVAAKMQSLLEAKATSEPNWLEVWWEALAYLQPRYGCALRVNPAACFLLPPAPQLQRAARLLHATAEYYLMMMKGELPKETLMKLPLCQFQFQRIFSTWREPCEGMDTIHTVRGQTHAVVIVSGHFFAVELLKRAKDGALFELESVASIHRSLHEIMETVSRVFDPLGPGQSPAPFTSLDDRDTWAGLKKDIRESHPINASSLKSVDEALTVLILERDVVGAKDVTVEELPSNADSTTDLFRQNLGGDARNRWFDKLCYIVYRNGVCGGNGEHSVADAIVAVIMWSWVCDRVTEGEENADDSFFYTWRSSRGPDGEKKAWAEAPAVPYELLRWRLSTAIEQLVDEAATDFYTRQRCKVDAKVLKFRTFGRRLLRWSKIPPDAFIQMAIQLAYERATHRGRVPVYESAHTRLFHHGRTSTVRSCTDQSAAFVASMADLSRELISKPETKARVRKLLVEAMQNHTMLTADALQAQGVDRHLLGLQVAASLSGVDPSKLPLFADPAYATSGGGGTYVLSTSNVTAGNLADPKVIGGFMPMVEKGVVSLVRHLRAFSNQIEALCILRFQYLYRRVCAILCGTQNCTSSSRAGKTLIRDAALKSFQALFAIP